MSDFDSIKQIFANLVFAFSDYKYFSTCKGSMVKAAFLDQNQTLFLRLRYYLFHFSIIQLYKLLIDEKSSIQKFLKKQIKLIKEEEKKAKFREMENRIDDPKVKALLERLRYIRNKYSAHLDPTRFDFNVVGIKIDEIEFVLDVIYSCIKSLNLIIENKDYVLPINEENLGYKLHKQYQRSIQIK